MEEHQVTENSFIASEGVGERLKQVFSIYKKNFVGLTLLILFYNVLAFVVSVGIWNQIFAGLTGSQDLGQDILTFIIGNTLSIVVSIVVFLIGILLYVIFFIPVFVGTLKSMRDAISGKEIRVGENLKYGFSHFFNVIKVYWYIFQYVFLTPALLLIAGLLVILIALFTDIDGLYYVGGLILIAALIIGVVYGVYRGLRSTFRLYAAIDQGDFTKESFTAGLQETKGKLWRILGNFILVGLIVGVSTGIVGGIINTITGENIEERSQSLISSVEDDNASIGDNGEDLQIDGVIILNGLLITFIEAVGMIFITLFTYVLYLRIRDEYERQVQIGKNQDISESTVV